MIPHTCLYKVKLGTGQVLTFLQLKDWQVVPILIILIIVLFWQADLILGYLYYFIRTKRQVLS